MAKKRKNKVKKRSVAKNTATSESKSAVQASVKKKRFNLFRFFKDVRSEVSKVTWPTRKETVSATLMVFAMVVAAAFFFFFVDKILAVGVRTILGLGA